MVGDNRIRVLIVDDHAVVRKGLAMVLRLEPDLEVVGEAGNGQRAVELARAWRPDVVLLDLIMPGMDGKETALALRSAVPGARILVLTGAELDEGALDVLAAGVDGYVLKDIEPGELIRAVHRVVRGEAYLHPAVARRVLDRQLAQQTSSSGPGPVLTARELEVLRWMATPATYREIAEELGVSEETVRSHAKHILSKLQQPNRAQAVLAAIRIGLIELPQ